MKGDSGDLSLSRTFKVLNGNLAPEDIADKSASGESSARLKDRIGKVIDSKYDVLALLGEGGMGAVYRVNHVLLHKEMALKTFRSNQLSEDAWARFQREAQAIGKLTHANIVQVFDFGISEQTFPYYTMELITGESLAELIERRGHLSLDEALPIFLAVADGLSHAHRLGIVHRDIKPANIFMQRSGATAVPKIVDFGLAKLATAQNYQDSKTADQRLTTAGLVFGSPLYMSPEQSMGLETDGRSDIYSFGCSLYQALTGKPPFVGSNAFATIAMHQQNSPPSLNARKASADPSATTDDVFPERLEKIVAKLLRKEVGRRYQTFEEVIGDLSLLSAGSNKAIRQAEKKELTAVNSGSRIKSDSLEKIASIKTKISGRALAVAFILGTTVVLLAGTGIIRLSAARHPQDDSKKNIPVNPLSGSPPVASEEATESGPTYFSQKIANNFTEFDFPTAGESCGKIGPVGGLKPASGQMKFAPKTLLVLEAGNRFFQNPKLFRKFRSDDLERIILPPMLDWTEEHLKEVARLADLQGLTLAELSLPPNFYLYLNRMKRLGILELENCFVDGKDVLKLNCLDRLATFTADRIPHINLVLDKLTRSPALEILFLNSCQLNDADIEKISKVETLLHLHLSNNFMTVQGFKSLTRLHNLVQLDVAGTKLGPEIIDDLHNFKRLRKFTLSTEGWSQNDIKRLNQALPKGCDIVIVNVPVKAVPQGDE